MHDVFKLHAFKTVPRENDLKNGGKGRKFWEIYRKEQKDIGVDDLSKFSQTP